MNDKIIYWTSLVLSALALLLVIVNVCMINTNRNLQTEIAVRQGTINSGTNMSQLNQSLVQALAQAAVDDSDKDIRALLSSQGITVKSKAEAEKEKTAK